jgi:hypothetical protein
MKIDFRSSLIYEDSSRTGVATIKYQVIGF